MVAQIDKSFFSGIEFDVDASLPDLRGRAFLPA